MKDEHGIDLREYRDEWAAMRMHDVLGNTDNQKRDAIARRLREMERQIISGARFQAPDHRGLGLLRKYRKST